MVFAQSWTMSDLILAGLPLTSGGQGFSWATMNVAAGLIHRKIEETCGTKRNPQLFYSLSTCNCSIYAAT